MLKKFILLLTLVSLVVLAGCSSKSDKLTIDSFISAFDENGISVDKDNKPFFALIGASDGVTFVDDDKVVIYIYDSEKDLKKAREDYSVTKDWPSNGRFLIEAYNQDVIDIFNGVK